MKAKKSFGQHFLVQDSIASNIADSLTMDQETKRVLEIGPGMGMLTKFLLEKDYQLKVVEADRDMVQYIGLHYPALKDHIIAEDFLKVNLTQVFGFFNYVQRSLLSLIKYFTDVKTDYSKTN